MKNHIRLIAILLLIAMALSSLCSCQKLFDWVIYEVHLYNYGYSEDAEYETIYIINLDGELRLKKVPKWEGRVFLGVRDIDGTVYADENGKPVSPVKKDITLYCYWAYEDITVKVVDFYDESLVLDSYTLKYGETLHPLPELNEWERVKYSGIDGYFRRYVGSDGYEGRVSNGTAFIDGNETLDQRHYPLCDFAADASDTLYIKRKCIFKQIQVTFISTPTYDYQQSVDTLSFNYGTTEINYTPDDTYGKKFCYWSKTEGGEPFTDPLTEDITLHAVFRDTKIFSFSSPTVTRHITVVEGDAPIPIDYLPPEGSKTFIGWRNREDGEFYEYISYETVGKYFDAVFAEDV